MPLLLLAVFLGGAVGTALRLGIDIVVAHPDDAFPTATLGINLLGSLLLGWLVGRVWPVAPHWLRAALGPGLLGGFTTFSAVMASALTLTPALAALYLAASVVLGLLAAAAGLQLGHNRRAAAEVGAEQ
ncbi:CrcB family protein [Salinibacterium sp. ZJ450]|uniref:CrcB family protein n=1 Tax=Salinibacterium sp. ZJ450 TaxID=2708338 RepID=UPI00142464D1|nr:CrcB family protein [Salinibacterium sp. ZJ450]